jgi:AraC-like DNA-binding protein
MWGTPTADDVRELTRLMTCELAPQVPPHRSLAYLVDVEGVHVGGVEGIRAYLDGHAAALARQVVCQALVFGGSSLSSMIIAGYPRVFPPPFPIRAFDAAGDAMAWLMPDDAPSLHAVERFLADTRPIGALVAQVRVAIGVDLQAASLESVAAALACTPRTLQRRLRELGTTFAREHAHLQLLEAQRRLLDTDAKVAAIALDVGFASASHFTQAFRRATGLTPQAWRDGRRAVAR